jgi:hypothetical protein
METEIKLRSRSKHRLRLCFVVVRYRLRTVFQIIIKSGNTAFEFDHTATQRPHDRWQSMPEQQKRDSRDDDYFVSAHKTHGFTLKLNWITSTGEGGRSLRRNLSSPEPA